MYDEQTTMNPATKMRQRLRKCVLLALVLPGVSPISRCRIFVAGFIVVCSSYMEISPQSHGSPVRGEPASHSMVERRNLLEAVFAIDLGRSRGAPWRRAFYTNSSEDGTDAT